MPHVKGHAQAYLYTCTCKQKVIHLNINLESYCQLSRDRILNWCIHISFILSKYYSSSGPIASRRCDGYKVKLLNERKKLEKINFKHELPEQYKHYLPSKSVLDS